MKPWAPKTLDHLDAVGDAERHTSFNMRTMFAAYQACYPDAYRFTRQFEGGYVNDPDDPGGCTNMGITIGTLSAWRGEPVTCADVQALHEPEVGMIYFTNYWTPVWGNDLPVGLNTQVWDWGVNSGPSRSVKALQNIVGSTADGIMGPNTLKATLAYIDEYDIEALLHEYHDDRQAYYESLSTFDKYGNGWTRRNDECLELSLQLAESGSNLPQLPSTDIEARLSRLEAWASSY